MALDDEPITRLTVNLVRAGYSIEDCLRDATLSEVPTSQPPGARLFVSSSPNVPSWLKYVARLTEQPVDLQNRSSSAVLFVSVVDASGSARLMALTFGGGHHDMNPTVVERDFGLRVVLNCVRRGAITSIDAATPDATTMQRRVQASRSTDISAFGVDIERDLLRVAAGTPTDPKFASFVAGRDSLSIQCRVAPQDLPAKLGECLRLSKETAYKADFDWIDNIRIVREKDKQDALDDLLLSEVKSVRDGHPSDLHMTAPEVQDYTEGRLVAYYGRGFDAAKTQYPQLELADYLRELSKAGADPGLADFKSHEVRVSVDGSHSGGAKWKVTDCLVWEADLNGSSFVLFAGSWYQVDQNFAASVEADMQRLLKTPAFVVTTGSKNEKEFIRELESRPDYINLDQTKLSPGGVKGANIEFSDFLDTSRRIFHLKDGHSSSAISHLWNQGLVCGDAMSSDQDFRKRLRSAVRKRERQFGKSGFSDLLPIGPARVDTSKYTIAYGILRRKHARSGKLDLPFFSKISMRPAAKQLQKLGYVVELHIVEKITS